MLVMSETLYILRKKSINYIEHELVNQFGLKMCFKNGKERIFKNTELLVKCHGKYVSVLIYDNSYKNMSYQIRDLVS